MANMFESSRMTVTEVPNNKQVMERKINNTKFGTGKASSTAETKPVSNKITEELRKQYSKE